uniref:Uncharacterized protein n=1 Tax=Panagrellus redivivus TaxID=6233 RepID=A0A7E5A1L3_PANRE
MVHFLAGPFRSNECNRNRHSLRPAGQAYELPGPIGRKCVFIVCHSVCQLDPIDSVTMHADRLSSVTVRQVSCLKSAICTSAPRPHLNLIDSGLNSCAMHKKRLNVKADVERAMHNYILLRLCIRTA